LSSAINEAKQKKEDLARSPSLNRLGIPEARENTLLYLTSVLRNKITRLAKMMCIANQKMK
jgi:hypothetical protein